MFAHRVRAGTLAASGRSIKKRSVEQHLRSVGQIFASVGARDPRMDDLGAIDLRIRRQLRSYDREDPPPSRVRPVPLQLLLYVFEIYHNGTPKQQAVADLCIIAFFFLLRPGEYCEGGSDTRSTPFRLRDIQFFTDATRHSADVVPLALLNDANFCSLTFNDQKNAVKGECMGHGTTPCDVANPIKRLASRVRYLRENNAPPDMPLAAYKSGNTWIHVKSTDITDALRAGAIDIGPSLGFGPADVSARAMRAGGAMALLLADVDSDKIRLIGRWKSDEMLRYLHTTARPIMQNFAAQMVQHGAYALIPTS